MPTSDGMPRFTVRHHFVRVFSLNTVGIEEFESCWLPYFQEYGEVTRLPQEGGKAFRIVFKTLACMINTFGSAACIQRFDTCCSALVPLYLPTFPFKVSANRAEWMAMVHAGMVPLSVLCIGDAPYRCIDMRVDQWGRPEYYLVLMRKLNVAYSLGGLHKVTPNLQMYGKMGWVPARCLKPSKLPTIYYRSTRDRRSLAVHVESTVTSHAGYIR